AGLASKDSHVDESRREHKAPAIDHLGIVWLGFVEEARADVNDFSILDEEATLHVQIRRWIDQPGATKCNTARTHGALRLSRAKPRESASSTAMRMATPISTCSRIRLTSMSSATSESISTPRFMGPGCITSAPAFAWASFSRSSPQYWKYSRAEGTN